MNTLLPFTNALNLDADGWAQLAPFGDHRGVAFTSDGPRVAIQRVDRQAGEAIRASLHSLTGKARRFFRAVPIFNGHPDSPQLAHQFADAEVKGTIADIAVRDDGIWIRPAFNEAGMALLNSTQGLGFSAYVDAEVISDDGKTLIARWTHLRSAGLTDKPNLPVELVNMNPLAQIAAALAAKGITLANATPAEADVLSGIATLAAARDQAAADVAAKVTELTAANTRATTAETALAETRTALANAQADLLKETLGHAIESGRIAEADRGVWEGRLKANFANEAEALRKLTPQWKVGRADGVSADGRKTAAGAQDAERQLIALANAAMKEGGVTFEVAWQQTKVSHPALHQVLAQPAA